MRSKRRSFLSSKLNRAYLQLIDLLPVLKERLHRAASAVFGDHCQLNPNN